MPCVNTYLMVRGQSRPTHRRPVVFEDAGLVEEDTVHLHLEQRVAQRLLARFRAQGFVYHDLSRACRSWRIATVYVSRNMRYGRLR